ncbi:MAG: hypothetical protein JOZ96_00465 [Acidobacteria bacterium]|nr:hypothetical protein [Acidobacteriota bacterium]
MRRQVCVGALALSFLLSLAALPAAAKSVNGLRAQVPFDFHVGGRLVRACAYTVSSMTDDEQLIRIGGADDGASTTTNSGRENNQGEGRARLVFHRYGDQFYLAAVWGADGTGRTLSESKRERSLRKELSAARGVAVEAEVVTIDAR